jgi:hypothetical protein
MRRRAGIQSRRVARPMRGRRRRGREKEQELGQELEQE